MRVKTNPKDATIARAGEVEYQQGDSLIPGNLGLWQSPAFDSSKFTTGQLVKLGATFEKELEAPQDGKEYEIVEVGEFLDGAPAPKGTKIFCKIQGWQDVKADAFLSPFIYAIPKQQPSCVEPVKHFRKYPCNAESGLLSNYNGKKIDVVIVVREEQ